MSSKKRADGEGSIYFEATRSRWIGRLPRDSRGRRRKVVAKTRGELVRKLRAAEAEQQTGVAPAARRQTLGAYLTRWADNVLPISGRSPRTVESYAATIWLHLVPGLGRVRLDHLTPGHVQAFLKEELDAGKGERTVQLAHAVLRTALADAERWDLVERNVARLTKAPRPRSKPRQPFTPEELRAILREARHDPLFPLIVLAHGSGLRQSELLGLRWVPDVDLEHRCIHVEHQLGLKSRKLEPLKTRAARRTVPLPQRVVEVLAEHRERQNELRKRADRWADPDLVFTTGVGTPLSHRNVHRSWTRILERAAVEHRGMHHLRHGYATSLAEHGVNERAAQHLLGHADSRTTREVYTHTTDRMLDLAARIVDESFETSYGHVVQPSGPPSGPPNPSKEVNSAEE